jgi:7-cyano-7-deazaguanine synthase
MYDVVCLTSGGLDSVVCLHLLRQQDLNPLPVFIDYGQRNREREFNALAINLESSGFAKPVVFDVSGFGRVIRSGLTDGSLRVLEDAFTPNRNLLFLVLASSVAHTRAISKIALGFLTEKSAIFPDQTDVFLKKAQDMLSESLGVNFRIITPLRDFSKANVVELAKKLGIHSTYSCHLGESEPCGRCIACMEYKQGD